MRGYLLDTNVLSELRKGKRADPNVLAWYQGISADDLFTSVLVFGEIRSGIERIRPNDPAQAKALDRWFNELETSYVDRILPISVAVADRWGRFNAVSPISVIDGLMAATALENDLTLVTRNVHDVMRTGAKLLNPFQLGDG
jgi:Predicted nucleic acid-binding protein, contains PIN domain